MMHGQTKIKFKLTVSNVTLAVIVPVSDGKKEDMPEMKVLW
jgi:hypothetical protein